MTSRPFLFAYFPNPSVRALLRSLKMVKKSKPETHGSIAPSQYCCAWRAPKCGAGVSTRSQQTHSRAPALHPAWIPDNAGDVLILSPKRGYGLQPISHVLQVDSKPRNCRVA